MEPRRFDTLTRSLSARLSRRGALKTAGAGLAGTAALAVGLRATVAQDATPAVTPTTDPLAADASFLFVQSATGGTFATNPDAGPASTDGTPTPGGGADYLLTLSGHTGNTVYFSDRPERIFGESPTQAFLAGLGFSPDNPPNAALVTNDENGNEDILVVELLNPTFDADAGSVTYGVNILSDYEGGLGFVAGRQQDEDLAPSFGTASLFIDDCPTIANCYLGLNSVGPVPGGPIDTCWKWSDVSCEPCNGNSEDYYDNLCNSTYGDACTQEVKGGELTNQCTVYTA